MILCSVSSDSRDALLMYALVLLLRHFFFYSLVTMYDLAVKHMPALHVQSSVFKKIMAVGTPLERIQITILRNQEAMLDIPSVQGSSPQSLCDILRNVDFVDLSSGG